jgi:uncharacterized membrane protein
MDSFLFLLGLLLLAFPIIAIVALVKALTLGDHMRRIDARLAALERQAAAPAPGAAAVAAPPPAPEPERAPEVSEPIVAAPAEPAAASFEPEPPIAPTAPPQAPPPPQAAPATPAMSLEERLGSQWAVWVGGIALALGGIFLVRYSIEQGLVGPAVRITLGALLALALIAAGEWARRSEWLTGMSSLPRAHIPGILTAAGTTIAYADVYAAYGLHGFLAPGVAFILLGLVALATLAAALLHGPALAGLGLAWSAPI